MSLTVGKRGRNIESSAEGWRNGTSGVHSMGWDVLQPLDVQGLVSCQLSFSWNLDT